MNFKNKSDYIVFVGRFQPFHSGHKAIVEEALNNSKTVIIAVGSYRASIDSKNPWTFEERKSMIKCTLGRSKLMGRVIIVPLRDYTYSDTTWISSLQNIVASIVGKSSVKMIGHFKDDSSIYLTFFPQWPLLKQPNYKGINGTDIRSTYFNVNKNPNAFSNMVPPGIYMWMKEWQDNNPERYNNIVQEIKFLKEYNARWKDTPFPVNFVTTDAVVIQSGHVLMVRRRINPGKGKLALPGGFLGPQETIFDGCIRELYEETKINVPKKIMHRAFVKDKVFDHPKRSQRGRIITHAHLFELSPGGPLPTVNGSDDAYEALWIPFNDIGLNEQNIFSDHIHIIQHFINLGR